MYKKNTLKYNLDKAYKELREKGYICEHKYWCCQSCACADLPEDCEKYVFYHEQDEDRYKETGSLMLAWGGDGEEIINALESNGIDNILWTGNKKRRIEIRD
jgi:hypothetical protein